MGSHGYLYRVLIGARLWLPGKRQDAWIEGDGDVDFHLLLVPHRHPQRVDTSILQGGEGAICHHDNQVSTQAGPRPSLGTGPQGRFFSCGGVGRKMPGTLRPSPSPWRRLLVALQQPLQ